MTRFRNRKGFSTLEVLITLALVGFFIVPIITIQVSVRNHTVRSSHILKRLFFMIYLLHHARHEQDKIIDKKQELPFNLAITEANPATQLTYVREAIPASSVLANIPGLSREIIRTTTVTMSEAQKPTQTLVTFVYHQPENQTNQDAASSESASRGH